VSKTVQMYFFFFCSFICFISKAEQINHKPFYSTLIFGRVCKWNY
jgi:hypothetical protein